MNRPAIHQRPSQGAPAWRRFAASAASLFAVALTTLPVQADNHALIMTIDYQGVLPFGGGALVGIDQDARNAQKIAQAMGIPADNTRRLHNGQLGLAGLRGALQDLLARIQDGDKVFLYYSGHGYQGPGRGGAKCSQALVSNDLQFLYDDQLTQVLNDLSAKASQVVMFNDSCFSGGAASIQSKGGNFDEDGAVAKFYTEAKSRSAADPDYQCGQAVNKEAQARTLAPFSRPQPARMLYVSASADNEVSYATPNGSVATLAWAACLVGNGADRDRNGMIDATELRQCAQSYIQRNARRPQTITLRGNEGLPLSFTAPEGAGNGAAISGTRDTLQKLRVAADPSINVALNVEKAVLKINQDLLNFSVRTDRNGYLYLLHVDTEGKFYVLFPNRLDQNNFLKAGVHSFPKQAWDIRAEGPAGTGYLMAYLSESPRDFGKDLGVEGPFATGEATDVTVRKLGVVALSSRFGASEVVDIREVP
jgi:hypothetical protein